MKALPLIFLALIAILSLGAAPRDTPYGKTVFRLESRPGPDWASNATVRKTVEGNLAAAGVDGRWIAIVDPVGAPYLPNSFVPAPNATASNVDIMKSWVKDIHDGGGAVMSWYPLCFCQPGFSQNPSWRQISIEPWPNGTEKDMACCFNSAYGQAMIDYCNYAIDTLGLDGIWFDGSVLTPIWEAPVPLTCICPACMQLFKSETGYDIPKVTDWSDPVFRTWIDWRFKKFGAYI